MEYTMRGHHLVNIFYYLKLDKPTSYSNTEYEEILSSSAIKVIDDFDFNSWEIK